MKRFCLFLAVTLFAGYSASAQSYVVLPNEWNSFVSFSSQETSIPFYYVEDGEFREFGGLKVNENNFKKILSLAFRGPINDIGYNQWIEQLELGRDGWKVINIIYRDLGRVKFLETNFDATSTDRGFVCVRNYYGNYGEHMGEKAYYGNAKLANTPQIAVYPDID